MWAPCLMHRWNRNPTLSQNHNLPTYLSTHLPIEFPTCLCASFLASQALVPTFSFSALSLPTLPTFSLFLSKNQPLPFQNHNLPTYLPTHLPIEFPNCLWAAFLTSQGLVPTFSFLALSLPTLPTFSIFQYYCP